MKKTGKKQNRDKKDRMPTREEYRQASFLGVKGVLGVSLLAGALFNIPEILKKPETGADRMMLAVITAMALGGIILLYSRFRKK